jgi:hypothetical protein
MKKIALCVGINAYPPGSTLAGCVNDAKDWAEVLSNRGFDVHTMLDGEATLRNLHDTLKMCLSSLNYGDRFVFQYSGHGTWDHDSSGDEPDGRDEAICPVDCFDVGMLYDDQIALLFSSRRYGSRAVQISDSCHSGSVSRFLDLQNVPLTKQPRFLPPEMLPRRTHPAVKRPLFAKGHLLLAGCGDLEYSYDAWFGNRPNGAFTRAAIDALGQSPSTYNAWHKLIRAELPSPSYPQSPVIDGSYYRKRQAALA